MTGCGHFCFPCYNDDFIREKGVRFDNARLEPVTLAGVDGEPHTFAIQSLVVPTGHRMKAVEVRDGEPRGYEFAVLGDFEADALALFQELYRRMRQGLAQTHVKRTDLGWQVTKGDRIRGRILWDPETHGETPLVVIDGREFSWDEVGRMLMSYEGFAIEMAIRDSIDVVGGPLLEEGEKSG